MRRRCKCLLRVVHRLTTRHVSHLGCARVSPQPALASRDASVNVVAAMLVRRQKTPHTRFVPFGCTPLAPKRVLWANESSTRTRTRTRMNCGVTRAPPSRTVRRRALAPARDYDTPDRRARHAFQSAYPSYPRPARAAIRPKPATTGTSRPVLQPEVEL